jgi:hypothetical protein
VRKDHGIPLALEHEDFRNKVVGSRCHVGIMDYQPAPIKFAAEILAVVSRGDI